MERDYPVTKRGFTSVYFNSHAHVERDEVTFTIAPLTLYFNSHAHVERDSADTSSLYTGFISTHTLTWSVTTSNNEIPNDYANFNSHAHVERDDTRTPNITQTNISTHTLTWSVTMGEFARYH